MLSFAYLFGCCIPKGKPKGITITISFNCCNKLNKRKNIQAKKLTIEQVEMIENYINQITNQSD